VARGGRLPAGNAGDKAVANPESTGPRSVTRQFRARFARIMSSTLPPQHARA
jgi:hypothetical protein